MSFLSLGRPKNTLISRAPGGHGLLRTSSAWFWAEFLGFSGFSGQNTSKRLFSWIWQDFLTFGWTNIKQKMCWGGHPIVLRPLLRKYFVLSWQSVGVYLVLFKIKILFLCSTEHLHQIQAFFTWIESNIWILFTKAPKSWGQLLRYAFIPDIGQEFLYFCPFSPPKDEDFLKKYDMGLSAVVFFVRCL